MANAALLSDHKFNAFAWFIASGVTVDSVTVAADAKPDVDPTSNWPWLGCVLSLTPFVETEEDDTIYCPNFNGGYDKTDDSEIVGGGYVSVMRKTNELLRRLELGLGSELAIDTAQEPFKPGAKPYIEGWLKLTRKDSSGNDVDLVDLWCRASLDSELVTERGVARPQIRFTRQPSTLNTYVPKS
ncbi:hypothetical protein AAFN60_02070 [Roseibacillus persicicus]|uniref:hypothetical protein n=1 Tax=Roseibacillus persicicus TaxID=454148 RepID=UPI00398B4F92